MSDFSSTTASKDLAANMIKIIPYRIPPIPSNLLRMHLHTIASRSILPRRVSVPKLQESTVFRSRRYYANDGKPLPEAVYISEAQNQPRRISRHLRPALWAFFGLTIGAAAGQFLSLMIAPPPMPEPGSPTDDLLSKDIQARANQLPIVQQLSASPEWRSWDAYNGFDAARKERNLTAGVLDGARSIGAYQRIWWNESTGEVISVFWIGASVSGYPGVAHGGLLATILDESLGRCAMLPRKAGAVTANLNVTYRAPTHTNSFFVIRTWPIEEGSTDRKAYVEGRLEEPNGKVCAEANALYVVPKNLHLGEFTKQGVTGF